MTYPVKWFTSGMRGAPTISGTPGSRIAALDACLITGFGAVTATGVTVSGGIATLGVPSGQTFAQHAAVLISGATPSALNGEHRVLTSSSTQITVPTTAADGAASGKRSTPAPIRPCIAASMSQVPATICASMMPAPRRRACEGTSLWPM